MQLTVETPIGPLKITYRGEYIINIAESDLSPRAECPEQISDYFNGTLTNFTYPIKLTGTPFQIKVWEQTIKIPYGQTQTYAQIARAIGHPNSARAVGTALGHNPILLIVPCHRVVASNGLGGFRLGTHIKQWLINHEVRNSEKFAKFAQKTFHTQ